MRNLKLFFLIYSIFFISCSAGFNSISLYLKDNQIDREIEKLTKKIEENLYKKDYLKMSIQILDFEPLFSDGRNIKAEKIFKNKIKLYLFKRGFRIVEKNAEIVLKSEYYIVNGKVEIFSEILKSNSVVSLAEVKFSLNNKSKTLFNHNEDFLTLER